MRKLPLWTKAVIGCVLVICLIFVLGSVTILLYLHFNTWVFVDNKSADTLRIIRAEIDHENTGIWRGKIEPGGGLVHRIMNGTGRHRIVIEVSKSQGSKQKMACDFEIRKLPSICKMHFTDLHLVCEYCVQQAN